MCSDFSLTNGILIRGKRLKVLCLRQREIHRNLFFIRKNICWMLSCLTKIQILLNSSMILYLLPRSVILFRIHHFCLRVRYLCKNTLRNSDYSFYILEMPSYQTLNGQNGVQLCYLPKLDGSIECVS